MIDAVRTFSSAGRLALGRLGLLRSRQRPRAHQASAQGPRGRLFRKYVLLFIGLVSFVLLLNSALDFWFTYDENKAALFQIQQEKAGSAARRIEQFVDEIERQLGWTTAPQWATGPLEQRKFDYVRLLRQVPAITELIQLDDAGKEQLKVSRLAIDVIGSEKDYSETPSFIEARKHRVWFSPVYFRKESEPYMTLAMARAGRNAGVTIAEVNLKLIWDVITGLKIGQGGYAYVVDRDGRLIAHPDISLVLRNTDLAKLPQVAAAHAESPGGQPASSAVMIAKSIYGGSVLTAHAAIAPLGWTVFVELPLSEALAPLYGSALRTAALLALALGLATLAALFLARRMTGPIRLLQAGAARIGAGELDRRIDIHTGDELEGLAGDFNRMAGDLQKSYAGLERKVEERTAELTEALDQQTATAEVLQVINSSPGNLAPVFDAMLEKAMHLCEAAFGVLWTYDGERLHAAAIRGATAAYTEFLTSVLHRPAPNNLHGRLLGGERLVHFTDVAASQDYNSGDPMPRALVDLGGGRTLLAAPLRKDNAFLGDIVIYRREVRPFSDKQIALLQNFAAQAVIAMENARLITETREALDQQIATAEVLQVINSSPGDLAPVFEVMLEKAVRLCEAAFGILWQFDGDLAHPGALYRVPEAFAEFWREPRRPTPDSGPGRMMRGEGAFAIADLREIPSYQAGDPMVRAIVESGGARSVVIAPLHKDDATIGAMTVYRQEVRPFSDKQVALLQNFAAQAVIAMENARLITETREALEQQTATAEVLGVINSSPGDLAPVFDAMLEKAIYLCQASFGTLWTYDGEGMRAAAVRDAPREYTEFVKQRRFPVNAVVQRLLHGEQAVQIADLTATEGYGLGDPLARELVERAGNRTLLAVALRKEDSFLGMFAVYRREVRPFSDKQIALLQNFAVQAVIAMENARLITETREALEQQTATAEVLGVINSSPGDLEPVFDAMLEKAMRLCEAAFGVLVMDDGEAVKLAARRGLPPAYVEYLATTSDQPGPGGAHARLRAGANLVQVPDLMDEEAYRSRTDPYRRALVELGGARTLVAVALRKDETLVGSFNIYRQDVRPFSDKQIALLQNFAAQAVIAMENARLITETREALEQQTATAEVLGVINSSPGDLGPVFDTVLEKAMRLCEAAFGLLMTFDGDVFWPAAHRGLPPRFAEYVKTAEPGGWRGAHMRLSEGADFAHIVDAKDDDTYRTLPSRRALVDLGGARSVLLVPLRKDSSLLGSIAIYRQEVRPFSDKQVALLQNFAAQAVIAMENARLITETREALEQQTATAEVLGVINSSPGDLAPVFDAILDKAHGLCRIALGELELYEDGKFSAVAVRGVSGPLAELLRQPFVPPPNSPLARLLAGEPIVQIADLFELARQRPDDPRAQAGAQAGLRTVLFVPLRKDDALLGYITAYRQEVRPFSQKEIALLKNFAAQAVIAMENTRLITETREALEQQTATAEVLGVINSSPGDLAPVFDAMLEKAIRLCEATHGHLFTYDGESFHPAAVTGEPSYIEWSRRVGAVQPGPSAPLGRISRGERIVHIADVREEEVYRKFPAFREQADIRGVRSQITVGLLKDNTLLGAMVVYRQEVRPFSDKQIALLQNFAAQAVIAMENARLITETREALDQQTATAEVLQVINSSPGDLAPVFDAILDKAHKLCGAEVGRLFTYDGERFTPVAAHGASARFSELRPDGFRPGPGNPFASVLEGEPLIHVADIRQVAAQYPDDPGLRVAVEIGVRTFLLVPLRKDDVLLGAITASHCEVRPFTDKQIALLQNFAAQAVIAMENARLITETRESLEYQTATSEVLRVVSRSAFDLETVLQAVVTTAIRLCRADSAVIYRNDDGEYRWAAGHMLSPEYEEIERNVRIRPGTGTVVGRAALEGATVQILDAWTDPLYEAKDDARVGNVHTMIGVPLLREGVPIGVIGLARRRVEAFSEREIQLVTTFADQAVIAIENARLLGELRERTDDLQESLEYQTATSDVLKVISQSTFDLQPVLETLAGTASRLCEAQMAFIFRREGELYRVAASVGFSPETKALVEANPISPGRGTVAGRTALTANVVHIPDARSDPEYTWGEFIRVAKTPTMLGVPLLREGVPVGVIVLARERVEPFSDKQIELVRTFADQAVIAIENARLFNELRARTDELGSSVAELKMLSEVAQAVSSTLDLRAVLSTILNASLGVTWANAGAIFRYSRAERAFRLVEAVGWDEALMRSVGDLRLAETETAMGEAVARRVPVQLADTTQRASNPLRDLTVAAGFRSALIVPLVGPERILGAILLMRQEAGEFPPEAVRLMQTLASQSVLAIQNARLFREIADKSEQLALASQHKSQFLANMSHELRTPLNAILGYAELLVDGIYGVLPERPSGVLERIQNNGRHLLALINDVLDLAKIEAGQLTLTLEDYSLPEVVRSVVTATEPLATGKGLKFTATLQADMPKGHGDARRLSQVLLNLVGNAIKFTDAGEVEIRGSADRGQFVLEVRDTGPGIPDADQDRIFGEFQQIDNSNTRQKGGTGLGLAISKRMVEMQGGTISVESVLGQGSTFRVVLPVHVDEMMEAAE